MYPRKNAVALRGDQRLHMLVDWGPRAFNVPRSIRRCDLISVGQLIASRHRDGRSDAAGGLGKRRGSRSTSGCVRRHPARSSDPSGTSLLADCRLRQHYRRAHDPAQGDRSAAVHSIAVVGAHKHASIVSGKRTLVGNASAHGRAEVSKITRHLARVCL